MTESKTYYCSFCGKDNSQVRNLIAGPAAIFICNECVNLCQQINQEELEGAVSETQKTIYRVHYTVLLCTEAFADFDTERAARDYAHEKQMKEHEFMMRHFERRPRVKMITEERDL